MIILLCFFLNTLYLPCILKDDMFRRWDIVSGLITACVSEEGEQVYKDFVRKFAKSCYKSGVSTFQCYTFAKSFIGALKMFLGSSFDTETKLVWLKVLSHFLQHIIPYYRRKEERAALIRTLTNPFAALFQTRNGRSSSDIKAGTGCRRTNATDATDCTEAQNQLLDVTTHGAYRSVPRMSSTQPELHDPISEIDEADITRHGFRGSRRCNALPRFPRKTVTFKIDE